jgi:selenocysteine-specific elongation factor
VAASVLRKLGVEVASGSDGTATAGVARAGEWLLDAQVVPELAARLRQLVARRAQESPLDPSLTTGTAARALGLPSPELVPLLVSPPLVLEGGSIRHLTGSALPPQLNAAVSELEAELAESPFAAPDAGRLADLGLDKKAIGAATRAGRLFRVAENIVLLPDALEQASSVLVALPQPFTVSEARVALGTTRRVVLPLLELMDSRGLTQRHPDDRRTLLPR